MSTVTISPKFQVIIPLEIRKAFEIQPGEKLEVIHYGDRIELIPIKKLKKMRGFLRGITTTVDRENDRI